MEFQPSRRRRAAIGFMLTTLGALGAVSALLLSGGGGRAAAQVPGPVPFDGNKTCADLAPPGSMWTEFKVEPVLSGNYTNGTLSVTLTVVDTASGPTVNWSSNIGVDAVVVKGGPGGNLYTYPGESTSGTGLHAPVNPENGKYYGLSHISFCYDVDNPTTTMPTTTTTMATTTTMPTTTTTMATTTSKPHKTTTTMATTTSESSTTTTPVTTPTTAPPPKPPAPPELPKTGRNMTPLLLTSLAALGAGLGLIAASRRISRSQA